MKKIDCFTFVHTLYLSAFLLFILNYSKVNCQFPLTPNPATTIVKQDNKLSENLTDKDAENLKNNSKLNTTIVNNVDSIYAEINLRLSKVDGYAHKIEVLEKLAQDYRSQSIQSSVIILQKSLELAEKSEDDLLIVTSLINLSTYQTLSNNYQSAYDLLTKAEAILDTKESSINKNPNKKAQLKESIYNNYALISYLTENYNKAIEYYSLIIKNKINNKDTTHLSESYLDIAKVYTKTQNTKQAIDFFTKAIELSHLLKEKTIEAKSHKLLADVYFQQNDLTQCLKHYNISKDLYLENGTDDEKSTIMIDLGFILFKYADYYKSIAHLKKGIEFAEKSNNNQLIKQAYFYLHTTYYKSGDFRKAYETLQKYTEINEDLKINEINKTISEMQVKLDFDKKNTIKKTEEESSSFHYYLYVIIFLLTLIASFFAYKLYFKKS